MVLATAFGWGDVGSKTNFPVHGGAARYYVVWITKLDGFAHVSEVTARR